MRRLMHVLASSLATFGCTSALAGGTVETAEKAKVLSPSVQTGTLPSPPASKLTALRYEMSQGTSLATPIREAIAQENIQVSRSDRPTMQLRDRNELRYHYTAVSSLSLSARPHNFGFGWRTRF